MYSVSSYFHEKMLLTAVCVYLETRKYVTITQTVSLEIQNNFLIFIMLQLCFS